jgi:glycosyltransferase involved in cell wall biosynthesis
MKRILYLSRSGPISGSQRQLYYLLTNLSNGYEPVVVCPRDGEFFETLRRRGIEAHILPMHPWRKFPAALHRYLDAERVATLGKKYDAALVHSSDLWLSGYMAWVAERLRIPSILHVRTPVTAGAVRKHRCNRATKIIAISRRIRRNLLCAGIAPEKITHINDSVDLSVFKPNNETQVLKRDFPNCGDALVGIVGRIAPSKRQLAFLQAAEQVIRKSTQKVAFFIIGEVRDAAYFEQLNRFVKTKRLDSSVFFTGRLDNILPVLNSLDVLVSLSGGSIMFEAAACGKPVISADIDREKDPTLTKFVRGRPIILAGSITDLVEALLRLINNRELRKRVGCASREWAQSSFCHLTMAARTERVYEELIP